MPLKEKRLSQERSYFVVKDNQLITKSRYSLSLQQQKILLYFISRIKPMDEENTMYELSIKEFAKVCGYVEDSGYYYQSIKDDIKKLRDVSSWIEMGDGKEVLFSWIDRAEIDKKSGTLRVSFHYTVAPYLFELRERYTQYSLYNVLCLSHKYSIRLYEYLFSMQYKGTFTISIEELKKRIDAESYTKFSHFKDRVLEPAVIDIDNYTDLDVEYNFIKTGRAITHIVFTYHEKNTAGAVITHRLQERKINPEDRKETRKFIKEMEERREKRRKQEEEYQAQEKAANADNVADEPDGQQITIDDLQ